MLIIFRLHMFQLENHIFYLVYLLSREKKHNYEAITTTTVSLLATTITLLYM